MQVHTPAHTLVYPINFDDVILLAMLHNGQILSISYAYKSHFCCVIPGTSNDMVGHLTPFLHLQPGAITKL